MGPWRVRAEPGKRWKGEARGPLPQISSGLAFLGGGRAWWEDRGRVKAEVAMPVGRDAKRRKEGGFLGRPGPPGFLRSECRSPPAVGRLLPSDKPLLSQAERRRPEGSPGTVSVSGHRGEPPHGTLHCPGHCRAGLLSPHGPGVRLVLGPASPVQPPCLWGAAAETRPARCQPAARGGVGRGRGVASLQTPRQLEEPGSQLPGKGAGACASLWKVGEGAGCVGD